VARFGGEEFVLVYPEMNVRTGMEVLERIRAALADAVKLTAIPAFTASFGFTHSSSGVDVDSIIRIADAGLLMAKDLGRDRVVFADAELAAEIFAERREGV
jgi:diguanylate cyclase (GGDEF)-like protein